MDAEYWEKEHPQFVKPPPATNTDPFPAVPTELKEKRQWVLWKSEHREGKPTKIPYQMNRQRAKSNDPATWTGYQSVCREYSRGTDYSGIGFVFSESNNLCGVDLDHCRNTNGDTKEWAIPIVEKLKAVSYGEVSPSKKGIKFWTRAKLPPNTKHKAYIVDGADAIEAYDSLRYFTVTGQGKGQIKDGQAVMDWLVTEYLTAKAAGTTKKPKTTPDQQSYQTSSNEVIALIQKSKQSHKFNALVAGNTTGYGSPSEADQALCGIIVFWTQDPQVIDTIFRTSKLYRDKWDEKHRADGATYGQMTIEKALSGNRQTYTPPKRKKRYPRKRKGFYQTRWKRRRYR